MSEMPAFRPVANLSLWQWDDASAWPRNSTHCTRMAHVLENDQQGHSSHSFCIAGQFDENHHGAWMGIDDCRAAFAFPWDWQSHADDLRIGEAWSSVGLDFTGVQRT